jgi:predicted nuclease with TOPRIM domain
MTSLFSIGLFCFTNSAFQMFSFHILKMITATNIKIEDNIDEIQSDIKTQKEATFSLLRINDTLFNKLKSVETQLKELKESVSIMNNKFEQLIQVDVEAEFNEISSQIFNADDIKNLSPKSVKSEQSDIVFL